MHRNELIYVVVSVTVDNVCSPSLIFVYFRRLICLIHLSCTVFQTSEDKYKTANSTQSWSSPESCSSIRVTMTSTCQQKYLTKCGIKLRSPSLQTTQQINSENYNPPNATITVNRRDLQHTCKEDGNQIYKRTLWHNYEKSDSSRTSIKWKTSIIRNFSHRFPAYRVKMQQPINAYNKRKLYMQMGSKKQKLTENGPTEHLLLSATQHCSGTYSMELISECKFTQNGKDFTFHRPHSMCRML
jgi:hypothetical protein